MDKIISNFKNKISIIRGNIDIIVISDIKIHNNIIMMDNTIYIILNIDLYNTIIKKLDDISMMSYIFYIEEIYYCPMDNNIVPKHSLLENIEEIKIYGNMNFPRILFTDIIVRWYAWKRNSIIKIERNDKSITYRCLY